MSTPKGDSRRRSSAREVRRVEEAARYEPVERLALSRRCGFASVAAGNLLSEDEQWRRLELVVNTAAAVRP